MRYVAHGVTPQGHAFLATEWLEGEDLGARLARGPLGLEESLALADRVADALVTVHANGIVHCDLKPGNLFLVGGQITQVKLMDFGIARLISADDDAQSGVFGTPYYMAPEQASGDREVDTRADLYALGCVLFECLTGRPPFVAANPRAVLTRAMFERPPAPSELRPGLPAMVDALVAELLAKDASRRPDSAAAVARELRALLATGGESGTNDQGPACLTRVERRLVSVVLAADARSLVRETPTRNAAAHRLIH